MTQRLYYEDPYCRKFSARVVERLLRAGRPAVVLDRTAFYPTGGGQPNDRGTLGPVTVIDVVERDQDSAVLHVLSAPLEPDVVAGEIEWKRRFDLMQQHTGQHILSQAFLRVADGRTVGFHLTDEMLTIDLNNRDITLDMAEAAEDLANQVVFEDRPVVARLVADDELDKLPLRKPPKVETNIRVVEVGGFDWSPCGGTHLARTGEVGLVKVVRLERRSDSMRVEFRCGRRALLDYRGKNRVINQVAADLSVGCLEVDQAVARVRAEAKELSKRLADTENRLLTYEAAELCAAAEQRGDLRIVSMVWPSRSAATLRTLARKLIEKPGAVVLLASAGDQPSLVFARSPAAAIDMLPILRGAVERIGGRGGGGKPDFAQGGGPAASEAQVRGAVEWAAGRISDLEIRISNSSRGTR